MSTKGIRENNFTALDKLINEITVDAYGDYEELWAFRQALEDDVNLPADGFVIGEPVSVVEIDYDGNERRGLTAKCRREDGSEHMVAASDVAFPKGSSGSLFLAAYRRWLSLEPYPALIQKNTRRKRQHKVTDDDLDLSKHVELVVLSVKERSARCRLLGSERLESSWSSASLTCVAWTPTRTSVISTSTACPKKPSATTRLVCASESCLLVMISTACFIGV